MLKLCIRYTSLLLCSNYIHGKLLGQKKYFFSKIAPLFLFCLPFFLIFSFIPDSVQTTTYVLIPFIHFLFYIIKTNDCYDIIFLPLIISYALSYCIFILAGIITSLILWIIGWFLFRGIEISELLIQSINFIFMFLLSPLPFQSKRLKNGMPFLKEQQLSPFGAFLCFSVLFCITAISSQSFKNTENKNGSILLFISILLLFLALFTWWRWELKKSYLEQLKQRDFLRLESELKDCHDTITTLKQENQNLAHLVHRDNKQVAALALAVETYLSRQVDSPEETERIGNELLLELKKEMQERKDYVSDLTASEQISPTRILSIDCLLNFMLHKGQHTGISLDFSFPDTMQDFLQQVIDEQDLITLLADLLDNALIATKHAKGTHIYLEIDRQDNVYFIGIWDSGIPFTKEVLLHLGHKQYTTHKEDGGSGIGLMSIYERIHKYHASLLIDENLGPDTPYCKQIAIFFDNRNEYRLHPKRSTSELAYLHQRKDLHIL